MSRFALIGVAGYIAPRHVKAIRDTHNVLVTALDKSDSVGILDSYFPNTRFFTEFERFDRHIERLRRREDEKVDYISICSPNYLHDAHVRFALRVQADAICEKPLVLNPWNAAALGEIEKESGKRIWTILQLRLHPAIIELKRTIESEPKDKKHDIELTYITSRGPWYMVSWKGDVTKSGGVATNIGVHFFDMLIWIFGPVQNCIVHISEPTKAAGFLELQNARVRWFLSIDRTDLTYAPQPDKPTTYRSIKIDQQECEFSAGFSELHTQSYKEILAGNGFGLSEALPSIEIAAEIRNARPIGLKNDYHPFLSKEE